jgi:hypothetical protein
LGNDDHVEGREGYPAGRYFDFWALQDAFLLSRLQ